MHTQESIALAAGLLGQAKGDIAAARRAAGEAHAWLCSIDSSYKGEVKPVSDDTRQRLEQQVRVLTEAKAAAESEVRRLDEAFRTTEARMRAAEAKVKQLEASQAKPAPAPAPAPAMRLDLTKPPAPALVVQPVTNIAPPPPVNDPFAHLPEAMREFARKHAAGKLEID